MSAKYNITLGLIKWRVLMSSQPIIDPEIATRLDMQKQKPNIKHLICNNIKEKVTDSDPLTKFY